MKVIIDTDPGVDDAVALGIALTRSDVQVLAITTCPGNVDVEKTTINALKVLEVFERPDIPVYKGAADFLLSELQYPKVANPSNLSTPSALQRKSRF